MLTEDRPEYQYVFENDIEQIHTSVIENIITEEIKMATKNEERHVSRLWKIPRELVKKPPSA